MNNNFSTWGSERERQAANDLREREIEYLRNAIAQKEDDQTMSEDTSMEQEVWSALLEAYRKLKAAKPEDRSEKARRYAVTITEYEKVLSYFNTMVCEEFIG